MQAEDPSTLPVSPESPELPESPEKAPPPARAGPVSPESASPEEASVALSAVEQTLPLSPPAVALEASEEPESPLVEETSGSEEASPLSPVMAPVAV